MRICLIGSSRFEAQFKAWNEALTLAGHTVYSLAVYPSDKKGDHAWYTDEQKEILDLVHLDKILNSRAVVCIDCARMPGDLPSDPIPDLDSYVGDSTRRELKWADMQDKQVVQTSAVGDFFTADVTFGVVPLQDQNSQT